MLLAGLIIAIVVGTVVRVAVTAPNAKCAATKSRKFIGANLISSATGRRWFEIGCQACSSSSNTLASFRSSVSKPSVNQPYSGVNSIAG